MTTTPAPVEALLEALKEILPAELPKDEFGHGFRIIAASRPVLSEFGLDDLRRAREAVTALTASPATDGAPPKGYIKLPKGMLCKCFRLWKQGSDHYCCNPGAIRRAYDRDAESQGEARGRTAGEPPATGATSPATDAPVLLEEARAHLAETDETISAMPATTRAIIEGLLALVSAPATDETAHDENAVLIWSGEHRLYWRPSAAGYTADTAKAGRYSFADAAKYIAAVGPEKQLEARTIPIPQPVQKMHQLPATDDIGRLVEVAWDKALTTWMANSRHYTQREANEAAVKVLLDAYNAGLLSQLNRLRTALEPFAIACRSNTTGIDTDDQILRVPLTVRDLRRARAEAGT